jgi:hypothetical protein
MKTCNRKLWQWGFLSLLLSINGLGIAAKSNEKPASKPPLGCRDVGYQFELKILKLLPADVGDRQSLYFLFNALSKPLTLYQMRKEDSTRSLYLNHVIRPQQWAVLSTSEKDLKYICTVDDAKSSYGKVVDCSESLKVCEYARVKYGMNNRGNYWLVNSNTSGGAVNEVIHYGIIPR